LNATSLGRLPPFCEALSLAAASAELMLGVSRL